MTIWKRERTHFNYYITNERKQPHIYVEALGTPSASIAQKENLKKLKRTCKKVLFLYFHFFDLLLDQLLFDWIRCEKVHEKFSFKLIFFLIHFFYIQNSFKYHYRDKIRKQVCIFFYFLILIVFAA